jgi:hexulose-6-phosphate isomerase
VGVYYDLGNATSRGFQLGREIRLLGGMLVGVHVKDRKIHGPSVPLGQGDTDFTAAFQALQEIDYGGPFILETPRGADPLSAARENLGFVRQALKATGIQ